MLSIDSIYKGIKEIFGIKFHEALINKNLNAVLEAYNSRRYGRSGEIKKFDKKKKWLPTYMDMPPGGNLKTMNTTEGVVGPGSFIENKTGSWKTIMPVINEKKCTFCQICWFFCPEGCIIRKEKIVKIDYDYCKGCGICAEECPTAAITME